jgi:hypothetical protein
MSLEIEIKNLTAAVRDLIGVMNGAKQETLNVAPAAPVVQAPTPVAATVTVTTPEPVAAPAPVAAAPAMPAAPSFVAPAAPAPAASGAPFSDPKGLIDYVMGAYKALGAAKGAQIQNVLVGLGYQNINDVKPEHYGALHAGVEALKA